MESSGQMKMLVLAGTTGPWANWKRTANKRAAIVVESVGALFQSLLFLSEIGGKITERERIRVEELEV